MAANTTIWESASRPLFIRSVWLERAKTARAPQRHFILDYESPEHGSNVRNLNYFRSTRYKRSRKESLQQSQSYDMHEIDQSRISDSTTESLQQKLTVASSKLQLQLPILSTKTPKPKPKRTGPRKLTKRNLEKLEAHSGVELPAINKRLAERVLNWLDLAVKSSTAAQHTDELNLQIAANSIEGHKTTLDDTTCQSEAVKCVSIVFENQSGGPIKRAGNTERQHKSADMRRFMRTQQQQQQQQADITIPLDGLKRFNSAATKKSSGQQFLQDARKQIHIFLPSLPEKTTTTTEFNGLDLFVDLASTIDSASAH